MEPSELLQVVVAALERMRLRYLVTGSVATIYYGEPRYTNDIDVVVRLPETRIPEFCDTFPLPEFSLDEERVRVAVREHGQFNFIHPASGLKVDFMVPADTPFNRSRFVRPVRVQAGPNFDATFAAPEDVIIKKLEYYVAGGSEKHLRDITGVLQISGERVDRGYIANWAAQLGLTAAWEAVLARLSQGQRAP